MGLTDELPKLSAGDIGILFFVFVGTVAPGTLVIWRFAPEIFATADTAKLLLLSFAITVPLVYIEVSYVRLVLRTPVPAGASKILFDILTGCTRAIKTLTIPLLVSFFWLGMTARLFVVAIIVWDAIGDRTLFLLRPVFRFLRVAPHDVASNLPPTPPKAPDIRQ